MALNNSNSSFLDRFIARVDAIDANSLQAYILHLSRERGFFETVFNAVQEGILVVDRRLKIRYHNLAAKNMLGLPADISNLRLSQFLRNVDWRRILQQDENEWERLSRQEVEILYPQHRFIQFYLVPTAEDGDLAAVILRDITESRKEAMAELENETAQAVSMLAAGVAHEIGNPLNSLYLNLQLLQRSFNGESTAFDQAESLKMINDCKDEVERLDNIINQFLHALRPGHQNLTELDIRQIILETLNFMRQEIELRRTAVRCEFPDFLPHIQGDAAQLKQAFYNIIKNAIQAITEGGGIDILASYDEDYVKINFVDSGQGIDHLQMSHIFEPFISYKTNGRGLGMMIIERIFREHGADLAIDSIPGRGTAITVKFPRHRQRIRFLGNGIDPANAQL